MVRLPQRVRSSALFGLLVMVTTLALLWLAAAAPHDVGF